MLNTPGSRPFSRLALFLFALLGVCGAAARPASAAPSVTEVAREMVCRCGDCGDQSFDQCAPGCENGRKIRAEIASQIGQGRQKDAVLNHFADKYGENILGSPRGRGAGALAVPVPFLAVLLGLIPLALVLGARRSPRRGPSHSASHGPSSAPTEADDTRVAQALKELDF